ncbi:MAG: peptidylprolyl isomerase [Candidatus Omnitrophica bacterium]|nr:peptidylprolyl isomerase [Candidatus Omnitrophota bacterium]
MRSRGLVGNYMVLALLCFVFISMSGCDLIEFLKPKKTMPSAAPAVEVKGTLIAKVNNIPITLEDLNEEIESFNALVEAQNPESKITTRDGKIKYLKDEMIRRTLLYQESLDRGLDRRGEIIRALEKTKQNLLVMELVREDAEKIDVTSKEIEDYYNLYKEQLKVPADRQIREIVVPTESEARDLMVQLMQGADFAKLARERSSSPSAKEGGDLGFIQPGTKSAKFDTVAFSDSLETGGISNIFQGPNGYYILKLEVQRGGEQRSLSEMWDDIKRGLTFLKQQQAIEDLVGKLSTQAKIEVYEGEIK